MGYVPSVAKRTVHSEIFNDTYITRRWWRQQMIIFPSKDRIVIQNSYPHRGFLPSNRRTIQCLSLQINGRARTVKGYGNDSSLSKIDEISLSITCGNICVIKKLCAYWRALNPWYLARFKLYNRTRLRMCDSVDDSRRVCRER